MTSDPACCTPNDTVRHAAGLMQTCDCGCIPVVADDGSKRLIGVVTDRDLAIRATARGKGPETLVLEVMSTEVCTCSADDDLGTVEGIMAREQVRRVPVVDHAGCCIGMIAQADLALNSAAASDSELGRVVERISEPAHA
ncbi:MAG: CBS domain-containing protein [Gemmatimonadota bacterium]